MIVGIDLGTTHSLIGVFQNGETRLLANASEQWLTPSVVSISEDGGILVGDAARERLITHPQLSVANFKRWMGTNRCVRLGTKEFRAEELSAFVLKSLLADAEAVLGEKITEAIISVPAYFGDAQRKATRIAGELAGIRVERLINEPTAAALAYGLQERIDGSTFIILDLGGGTFDVSILEIFDGVMQVHASAGDNHLGGEDFLKLLFDTYCEDLSINPASLPAKTRAQLHHKLQAAKHRLATDGKASVDYVVDEITHQWHIDESRFSALAEPLLQRIRTPIERALRDAKLNPDDLNEIVLVGGASRMPSFTRLVARMLGRLPMRHVNPDFAIAQGSCVAAGLKMRNEALEEIVLTDVCPYTLGVGVAREDNFGRISSGHFSPIIERNMTVPISRAELFNTMQDGQREIRLEIFQGESPRTENNVLLGSLDIRLDGKAKKNEVVIEVRFTYDINGVLQVECTNLASKAKQELILQNNPGVLSEQEIRERLAALSAIKIHPREDQANQAVITQLERLYEERLDQRAMFQDWLVQFNGVLESQDQTRISRARTQLLESLRSLDS